MRGASSSEMFMRLARRTSTHLCAILAVEVKGKLVVCHAERLCLTTPPLVLASISIVTSDEPVCPALRLVKGGASSGGGLLIAQGHLLIVGDVDVAVLGVARSKDDVGGAISVHICKGEGPSTLG